LNHLNTALVDHLLRMSSWQKSSCAKCSPAHNQ
jgi:hypothetical protein